MSVFGAVCLGRPMVLAQQVDQTKYVVSVPNASNVSYITIFILPNSPFVDNNYTALVYFQLPSTNGAASEYKLLGGINPSKPSAIYKLNNNATHSATRSPDDIDMDSGPVDTNDSTTINIGISIEPTPQAEQLIQQAKSATSLVPANKPTTTTSTTATATKSPNETAVLANKIVGHAYNYLASFIDSSGKVPIKAFDNWWDKFKTKLNNNPNFLNELEN
ncbi:Protein OPI10 [Candida viswanathii]|uniref:Protein OPI10 n=1 Tax=Candida viswanathii TaxID=5486 RepID=A0A367YCR5_9ASCO|nr:Protein OPI10 [Candida viswanathii]